MSGSTKFFNTIAVAIGIFLLGLFIFPSVRIAHATPDNKVRICHSTASHSNPYIENEPAKSGNVEGHDGHEGPIWFSGIEVDWGDIIPPFDYQTLDVIGTHLECRGSYTLGDDDLCHKDGKDDEPPTIVEDTGLVTHSYPGKNWPEGEAIWNNSCEIPPIDVCTNIADTQETVPANHYQVGTECFPKDPVCTDPDANNDQTLEEETKYEDNENVCTYTDVCPNIGGLQLTVPSNRWLDDNGNCIKKDKALQLQSLCHDGPVGQVKVTNVNSQAYVFDWRNMLENFWNNGLLVAANDSLTFTVSWPGDIKIRYSLNGQDKTKKIAQVETLCTPPEEDVPLSDLETTELSCEVRAFDAKIKLTSDGNPVADVKVKFTYHGNTIERTTNTEGKAQVAFWYEGDEELAVEPDQGFASHHRLIKLPDGLNCPAYEIGVGGSGEEEISAPTELAETGVLTNLFVKSLGMIGGLLTLAGSALYAKKIA